MAMQYSNKHKGVRRLMKEWSELKEENSPFYTASPLEVRIPSLRNLVSALVLSALGLSSGILFLRIVPVSHASSSYPSSYACVISNVVSVWVLGAFARIMSHSHAGGPVQMALYDPWAAGHGL